MFPAEFMRILHCRNAIVAASFIVLFQALDLRPLPEKTRLSLSGDHARVSFIFELVSRKIESLDCSYRNKASIDGRMN
jgi:hypothetical protein